MPAIPASWKPLTKGEQRSVDRTFRRDLSFWDHRNDANQRTIIEPTNSVTYALELGGGHYVSDAYKERALKLCSDYVTLFRAVVEEDDFIIAYDPNHPSYKFWPHQHFAYVSANDWPVPPDPNGDYCAFFTSNLKACLFGFPWNPRSVCVIGGRFIDAMRDYKPRAFEKVLRTGGK